MNSGFLVFESGQHFKGVLHGNAEKAGEVVFNTSHSGYEEMATDPSYFSQILVCSAPQQGNYGVDRNFWESRQLWIQGFICLEIQNSRRDASWLERLRESQVPVLTEIDTRKLILFLREQGTTWGAIVRAENLDQAKIRARQLIEEQKKLPKDWTQIVCAKKITELKGKKPQGRKIAVYDFGCKENIIRELVERCQMIKIFPSGTKAEEIKKWSPDGILLSNGPGDPGDVKDGIEQVRSLVGYKPIFGICMGQQILSLALGGRTYKLKFGHRGSNHPISDRLLGRVYVASQNHGYNVDVESLPRGVEVTHINLNDQTVAGIRWAEKKCMSVQFHPESHPGPHDSVKLFDYFIESLS